ncbi:MAG: hypothetical protein L6Q92_10885 [Phycisphaerae bacterium]|nr:hypothetical protein [Phycisphaerae bacterium]
MNRTTSRPNPKPRSKMALSLAALGILLAIGAGVWGVSTFQSAPADDPDEGLPADLTYEQLKQAAAENPAQGFEQFRAVMERTDLTDEQREKAMDNLRRIREEEEDARLAEYYNAAESERQAILDKHIDEWQKRFEENQRRREQEEAQQPENEAEREKERQERRDRWRSRWAERSREERKVRSETRDPNKMAQRMAYFNAMRQRMTQRGIQPPDRGPFGRRGGGGPRGG